MPLLIEPYLPKRVKAVPPTGLADPGPNESHIVIPRMVSLGKSLNFMSKVIHSFQLHGIVYGQPKNLCSSTNLHVLANGLYDVCFGEQMDFPFEYKCAVIFKSAFLSSNNPLNFRSGFSYNVL